MKVTLTPDLPDGEPIACEWDWTVRTLHYHPKPIVPRRMYSSACRTPAGKTRMFTSLTLGKDVPPPQVDPTSGAIVVSEFDEASETLKVVDQVRFKECLEMHGIATSPDCSVVGALCRVPSKTPGFDKDVLATHAAADWMTNPYVCGSRLNDEMWLFEWKQGDIRTKPEKFIVHKSIGSWEYGNNYLRLDKDARTYGIAVKATVGGKNGPGTCHEADAFLIMDRQTKTYTNRGWSWACGTGHTTFNRPAYDVATNKYALMCSTDFNEKSTAGIGSFVFRMEDGKAQEFHYLNLDGIKEKGGASALVATDGGGFLGVLVGTEGPIKPAGYPKEPPTAIGLGRWDAAGKPVGAIRWIRKDPAAYLSYSTLARLGANRYLLGWGVMQRLSEPENEGMRVPWEFYVSEIDGDGRELTPPRKLEGAGWGELDELVPLGQGRLGWAYIPAPALKTGAVPPACNQPKLQLGVYTSARAD